MTDVTERLKARQSDAVKHFWTVRDQQATRQGGDDTEARDRGARSAVTGGKHIDGFIRLVYQLGSTSPVRTSEPHFSVFPEFRAASYAKRYEILFTKLVRERLYDAACFLMATREGGP